MTSLVGKPNRFFGAGETREQNATIKVYSAAELKQALTRVYGLANGVGTIEIAGDIVLTGPIRLRRFAFGESGPREIIIRGVSGAKILNGRTDGYAGFAWNIAGVESFPIFDFGPVDGTNNPVSKYTICDLQIGSESGAPLGAVVAGDIALASTVSANDIGLITLNNLKLFNVSAIFGAYDSTGAFAANKLLSIINPKVTDILYRNSAGSGLTTTFFNTSRIGCYSGSVRGIGVWNGGQLYQSEDDLTISNNAKLQDCTFCDIFAIVRIEVPTPTIVGQGNTISGVSQIASTDVAAGFSYINTNLGAPSSAGNTTLFRANSAELSAGSGTNVTADTPAGQIVTFSGQWEFAAFSRGGGQLISADLPDAITYCQYTVDFLVTVKIVNTGLLNSYHIRATVAIDAAGTGRLVSSTVVSASEESLTVSGLIPQWVNSLKRLSIAPTSPGGTGALACTCTVRMSGLKHPAFA
jgi:hypothetical protein